MRDMNIYLGYGKKFLKDFSGIERIQRKSFTYRNKESVSETTVDSTLSDHFSTFLSNVMCDTSFWLYALWGNTSELLQQNECFFLSIVSHKSRSFTTQMINYLHILYTYRKLLLIENTVIDRLLFFYFLLYWIEKEPEMGREGRGGEERRRKMVSAEIRKHIKTAQRQRSASNDWN